MTRSWDHTRTSILAGWSSSPALSACCPCAVLPVFTTLVAGQCPIQMSKATVCMGNKCLDSQQTLMKRGGWGRDWEDVEASPFPASLLAPTRHTQKPSPVAGVCATDSHLSMRLILSSLCKSAKSSAGHISIPTCVAWISLSISRTYNISEWEKYKSFLCVQALGNGSQSWAHVRWNSFSPALCERASGILLMLLRQNAIDR